MREGDQRRELGTVMDEIAQYRTYADECGGLASGKKTRAQNAATGNGSGLGYRRQTANERAEAFERGRFAPKSVKS